MMESGDDPRLMSIDPNDIKMAVGVIRASVKLLADLKCPGEAITVALGQTLKDFVNAGPVEYQVWMLAEIAAFLNEPDNTVQ